jgi:hypothetical protein
MDVGALGHDKILDLRLPIYDLKNESPNGGRLNTKVMGNKRKLRTGRGVFQKNWR